MIIFIFLAIIFDSISSFYFEIAVSQMLLSLQTLKHVAEAVIAHITEQNNDIKSDIIAKNMKIITQIDEHN